MTTDVSNIQAYPDLLQAVQPKPIRTEVDAIAMNDLVDTLMDLPELSEGQLELVGLLGQLLHDWETDHEDAIRVSPQEAVSSLLEDNGLRQIDLVGPVFPSPSAVSDFLHGRRSLSYDRVVKLAAYFHISPAVFYPAAMPFVGRKQNRKLGVRP